MKHATNKYQTDTIVIHNRLGIDISFLTVTNCEYNDAHLNNTRRAYLCCYPSSSSEHPSLAIRPLKLDTDTDINNVDDDDIIYLVMDEDQIKYLYDMGVEIDRLFTPVSLIYTDEGILVPDIEPIGIISRLYLKARVFVDMLKGRRNAVHS